MLWKVWNRLFSWSSSEFLRFHLRKRLGIAGGLGLDARPAFFVNRPTETCTPLKAHCVAWKRLERQKR